MRQFKEPAVEEGPVIVPIGEMSAEDVQSWASNLDPKYEEISEKLCQYGVEGDDLAEFGKKRHLCLTSLLQTSGCKTIPNTVLERNNLELSIDTLLYKFRLLYDLVELFEDDLYPDFSGFSEIIVEIHVFSDLH